MADQVARKASRAEARHGLTGSCFACPEGRVNPGMGQQVAWPDGLLHSHMWHKTRDRGATEWGGWGAKPSHRHTVDAPVMRK